MSLKSVKIKLKVKVYKKKRDLMKNSEIILRASLLDSDRFSKLLKTYDITTMLLSKWFKIDLNSIRNGKYPNYQINYL